MLPLQLYDDEMFMNFQLWFQQNNNNCFDFYSRFYIFQLFLFLLFVHNKIKNESVYLIYMYFSKK